jgi:hypothetical protein
MKCCVLRSVDARGEELRSEAYHGGDAGRDRLRRGGVGPLLLLRGRPAVAGQALNPGWALRGVAPTGGGMATGRGVGGLA